GYAFSLTPRGAEIDPCLRSWGKELGLETPKTPTCILFNEYEEFLSFGYEAKMMYTYMRGEEAQKHYFFENFRMALCDRVISRDVTIKAANKKSMKALKVFTEALRFLKEHTLRTISENTAGRSFTASDFTWVLTAPVIWDPSAKQFMREAAAQAGMVTEGREHNLIIALEPEAAAVWCKKLPADGFITENHDGEVLDLHPGTQYMVVDCGDETVGITVHEVLDGGTLKMLHEVSRNDLGGQSVDRKFKEFLREIFCDGVWDEYEGNFPSEVQKIMDNFKLFKKRNEDVEFSCPFNLGILAQKRQEIEKFFESVRGASWDEGFIRISKETLRSFFAESLKGITDSLREILRKRLNIEYILLVGGYAENQILRQQVIDQFGDQCKVLCPFRPQEAVMKGAVMLGRNPGLVASRKSAFTYGFAGSERFDESKHKKGKKFTADGEEFYVGWNESRTYILCPLEKNQRAMNIKFYRAERKTLMYVDDWGVEEVGSFLVDMPETTEGKNAKVELEIRFGSTEITATGTDLASGSVNSVRIDFMTKN
uniref:Heat shock protein family A (Hsp70) member 12A.2 n=1 Tax=Amphilophus citrinellus TaxID=61819 RepID=A0A3Q0T8W4_AMPCI